MLPLVVAAAGGDAKRGHLKKKIDLVADQTKRVAHSELGALDGRGNIRATSFAIVGRSAAIDAADAEHDRTGDVVHGQFAGDRDQPAVVESYTRYPSIGMVMRTSSPAMCWTSNIGCECTGSTM